MSGFFKRLAEIVFGPADDEDVLPDDGGLGEFAKQFAKQLEMEEKNGAGPQVSANDVMSVQHGRHGARAYLFDTTDFKKAIMAELRESVAPVAEGILKSRCGEKGTGYVHVHNLYIFHVRREDALEEYNAAMDIIDDIGFRLLGDRYLRGDRKMQVPVAKIAPDDMFKTDGTFDFKKAKKAVKWIRETGTHGPAEINWETGEVTVAEGAPEWEPDVIKRITKNNGNWQKNVHKKAANDRGEWQKQIHKRAQKPLGEWEKSSRKPANDAEQKEWERLEVKKTDQPSKKWETIEQKKKPAEEQAWTKQEIEKKPEAAAVEWSISSELGPAVEKKPEEPTAALEEEKPAPKPKPKEAVIPPVPPTDLGDLGRITLAFRPTWVAEDEAIKGYCGCLYRKLPNALIHGELAYPDDMDPEKIGQIDQALAEQAAKHLLQSDRLWKKIIILPFHLTSLTVDLENSPLKVLHDLDNKFRKSVWIEIVGAGTGGSASKITKALQLHRDKFKIIGLRFSLGDISKSIIERTAIDFMSCDVEESSTHGMQMRGLEQDLPDMVTIAKHFDKKITAWGIRNRDDLKTAIKEGCDLVNGPSLAKDARRPGKIIDLPKEKLLS